MTDERTMGRASKADHAAPGPGLFVLAVALIPLVHMFFLLGGYSAVLDGFLPGQDSYMRLVRVEQLYETGAWFNGTVARSNWPYGEVQNWTRPADVLMLSGALLLEPFLGFRQAIGRPHWRNLRSGRCPERINLRHSQPCPECRLLGVKRTKSVERQT